MFSTVLGARCISGIASVGAILTNSTIMCAASTLVRNALIVIITVSASSPGLWCRE